MNESLESYNLNSKEDQSIYTEKNSEINWKSPSAHDQIKFLNAVKSFEDTNGDFKEIPDLIKNGKFNKELFAGILLFKAPQYMLVGNEGAKKVIDFLTQLNQKINNPLLESTIEYLEEQIPYLDAADDISEKAFKDFDTIKNKAGEIEWLKDDTEAKGDILLKANKAQLLRVKAGVFFTNLVNKTYDALWNEYLIPKEDDGKNLQAK